MIKTIVYTNIFCFLTLVVANIHADSNAYLTTTPVCPIDEEFNRCGSACPPRCSDLFYPQEPKFCTKQCVSGCFCKAGLFRAKNGKCVKPEECCTRRNEFYTDCGTACPETCDYKPDVCITLCVPGCFCKKGFIRRDNTTNSPCIDPRRC